MTAFSNKKDWALHIFRAVIELFYLFCIAVLYTTR